MKQQQCLIALLVCLTAGAAYAEDSKKAHPSSGAKAFSSPKAAADALVEAAAANNVPALLEILGPEGKDLVSTGDPVEDKDSAAAFAAEAHEAMSLKSSNSARFLLLVGSQQWPLPIPVVNRKGKWYFDAHAGRDEILFRRIGANELDAIQLCLGYMEAQVEYAAEPRDDSGMNQYAQRLISTPGKHDGLFWRNADGTPGGPISEIVANAIAEGYSPEKPSAYHGYYFKILKGQGASAPLGRLDYVTGGVMIGGFAMIAVPAEYGVTGFKTFLVSNSGIVYEKDLGTDSAAALKSLELYNPDKTWRATSDEWGREK
jgi:hypothetical protein